LPIVSTLSASAKPGNGWPDASCNSTRIPPAAEVLKFNSKRFPTNFSAPGGHFTPFVRSAERSKAIQPQAVTPQMRGRLGVVLIDVD